MHQHDHSGHHVHAVHGTSHENRRRLKIVLGLSATYMVVEALGGWLTGSLALMADAGHLLSDVGALGLSLAAIWVAQRPATSHRTYGHTRAEIGLSTSLAPGKIVQKITIAQSMEIRR